MINRHMMRRKMELGVADAAAMSSLQGPEVKGLARVFAVALVLSTLFSTGCSRTFWRRQADLDAYALLRKRRRTRTGGCRTTPSRSIRGRACTIRYAIDCSPTAARRSDRASIHALRR